MNIEKKIGEYLVEINQENTDDVWIGVDHYDSNGRRADWSTLWFKSSKKISLGRGVSESIEHLIKKLIDGVDGHIEMKVIDQKTYEKQY